MGIHSRLHRAAHVLGRGVGREGQDKHRFGIGPVQRPDGLGGLTAVQPGHLQVHEDHVEEEGGRAGEGIHRLLSVGGPGDNGPILR